MNQQDPPPVTIKKLTSPAVEQVKAGGSLTPHLDVQLWLAHVCGLTRTQLIARPDHRLSPAQITQFQQGIARLAAGEPLPYLIGYTEFYRLSFLVTPDTLIPRPETEHLLEAALGLVKAAPSPFTVADVGTGSGCIAVALAANLPTARLYAIDINSSALMVAQENADSHQVDGRITFLQGHLLDPLPGRVHLIAANLPYVADNEWDDLPGSVRRFEPAGALRGGSAGLDLIEELLEQAPDKLHSQGVIMRVLIADDSKVAMLQLKRAIEKLGHEVVGHAKTGTAAVTMFKALSPDVVFLDIVMPELDGLGALESIREIAPNVPAVIVSSTAGVGSKVHDAAKLGAVAMISKPATDEAVEQALVKLQQSE